MATYVLLVNVKSNLTIEVGQKGMVSFPKGRYFYVGSARAGLDKRLNRHLGNRKNLHWHIDYLLECKEAEVAEVWVHSQHRECATARALLHSQSARPIKKGLGSSGCSCPAHLFQFEDHVPSARTLLLDLGFERWPQDRPKS